MNEKKIKCLQVWHNDPTTCIDIWENATEFIKSEVDVFLEEGSVGDELRFKIIEISAKELEETDEFTGW